MLDEISRGILKIIYGFGIEGKKPSSGNKIPPYCSSIGLQAIFSDIPKTTFYRKLNNLKKEGYITIKGRKKLSRNYEIINGKRIVISSKFLKSREVQLTEKGKKIASESLVDGLPEKIDVLIDGKVKKILFIDAVECLRKDFRVGIQTALFLLLNQMEKNKSPIDIDRIKQELSKKKK